MMAESCGTPTPATIARGANRTWPDADLHRVCACINKSLYGICRRHIAGDDLHPVGKLLDAPYLGNDVGRMPMCGINNQHIDTCLDQQLGAPETILASTCRSSNAQTFVLVLGGKRVISCLLHVIDGDEANAFEIIIDDDELLDAMLVQQLLGFEAVDPGFHRDQLFASSAR